MCEILFCQDRKMSLKRRHLKNDNTLIYPILTSKHTLPFQLDSSSQRKRKKKSLCPEISKAALNKHTNLLTWANESMAISVFYFLKVHR